MCWLNFTNRRQTTKSKYLLYSDTIGEAPCQAEGGVFGRDLRILHHAASFFKVSVFVFGTPVYVFFSIVYFAGWVGGL